VEGPRAVAAHNENTREKIFFPALDTLRMVAALMVFVQHAYYNAFANFLGNVSWVVDRAIHAYVESAGYGVQIFFVLSGFLITYLLIAEQERTGRIHVRSFYVRRLLRIWPLYYFVLLLGFFVLPLFAPAHETPPNLWSSAWYYFAFLANFHAMQIEVGTLYRGIVWSVAIEEQFYLVWPMILLLLPWRRQWLIPLVAVVVCLALRFYWLTQHAHYTYFHFHTGAVMADLAVGALLAYFSRLGGATAQRCKEVPRLLWLLPYVLLLTGMFFRDKMEMWSYGPAYTRFLFDLLFAAVIWEQCFASKRLLRLEKLRFLAVFGKYTYGLYMLHPAVLTVMVWTFHWAPSGSFWTDFWRATVGLVLSLSAAMLSYRWLELPFLKLKDRFTLVPSRPLPDTV
jgi:peptidoglycan/LPS O-acetylase OafA/YrhL